jgi:hypothetical protein
VSTVGGSLAGKWPRWVWSTNGCAGGRLRRARFRRQRTHSDC